MLGMTTLEWFNFYSLVLKGLRSLLSRSHPRYFLIVRFSPFTIRMLTPQKYMYKCLITSVPSPCGVAKRLLSAHITSPRTSSSTTSTRAIFQIILDWSSFSWFVFHAWKSKSDFSSNASKKKTLSMTAHYRSKN